MQRSYPGPADPLILVDVNAHLRFNRRQQLHPAEGVQVEVVAKPEVLAQVPGVNPGDLTQDLSKPSRTTPSPAARIGGRRAHRFCACENRVDHQLLFHLQRVGAREVLAPPYGRTSNPLVILWCSASWPLFHETTCCASSVSSRISTA